MRSCSDLPSGARRYSTATGRVFVIVRSTMPLRSSRRSAAVRDFWVTTGMTRRRPEAQRPVLAQRVEDLQRPFVEYLIEQLTVLLAELGVVLARGVGFLHDLVSLKFPSSTR